MERDRREELVAMLAGGRISWDDYRQGLKVMVEPQETEEERERKIEAAIAADQRGDSDVVRVTKDGVKRGARSL